MLCQIFLSFYSSLKIQLISPRRQHGDVTTRQSKRYSFQGNRSHVFCFSGSPITTIVERGVCALCVSPSYVRRGTLLTKQQVWQNYEFLTNRMPFRLTFSLIYLANSKFQISFNLKKPVVHFIIHNLHLIIISLGFNLTVMTSSVSLCAFRYTIYALSKLTLKIKQIGHISLEYFVISMNKLTNQSNMCEIKSFLLETIVSFILKQNMPWHVVSYQLNIILVFSTRQFRWSYHWCVRSRFIDVILSIGTGCRTFSISWPILAVLLHSTGLISLFSIFWYRRLPLRSSCHRWIMKVNSDFNKPFLCEKQRYLSNIV